MDLTWHFLIEKVVTILWGQLTYSTYMNYSTYYVSVESTNASKGGCAYYNVWFSDASVYSESPEPKAALAMPESALAMAAQDVSFPGLAAENSGMLA